MNSMLNFIRQFRSLLPVLSLAFMLFECKCVEKVHPSQVSSSANLVLARPMTDQQIRDRIRQRADIPADSIRIKRCPCDSALINIAIPNDHRFEGHEGEVATVPKGKTRGEGMDLDFEGLVSINRAVSPLEESQFPTGKDPRGDPRRDSFDTKYLPTIENLGGSGTQAISVAIFDSGLNPAYMPNSSWKRSTTLCTGNSAGQPAESQEGWNFMPSPVTALTADDQGVQHGSRVAYLLARQFTGGTVPLRIVPMKVLDKNNVGDLFGILCAMETARKNGVQVFNMSLGYYGDRDIVFAQYVRRAVDQGIWIVTAAGNQPDSSEERNLSLRKRSFYPAFFSKEFDRVIAATTISGGAVCDGQNFDRNFAVGVKEDTACRFYVLPPGAPGNSGIFGTSYAAPIVAGWLGRTLREQNLSGPGVTRQQLFDKMQSSSPVVPGLFQGRFVERK